MNKDRILEILDRHIRTIDPLMVDRLKFDSGDIYRKEYIDAIKDVRTEVAQIFPDNGVLNDTVGKFRFVSQIGDENLKKEILNLIHNITDPKYKNLELDIHALGASYSRNNDPEYIWSKGRWTFGSFLRGILYTVCALTVASPISAVILTGFAYTNRHLISSIPIVGHIVKVIDSFDKKCGGVIEAICETLAFRPSGPKKIWNMAKRLFGFGQSRYNAGDAYYNRDQYESRGNSKGLGRDDLGRGNDRDDLGRGKDSEISSLLAGYQKVQHEMARQLAESQRTQLELANKLKALSELSISGYTPYQQPPDLFGTEPQAPIGSGNLRLPGEDIDLRPALSLTNERANSFGSIPFGSTILQPSQPNAPQGTPQIQANTGYGSIGSGINTPSGQLTWKERIGVLLTGKVPANQPSPNAPEPNGQGPNIGSTRMHPALGLNNYGSR